MELIIGILMYLGLILPGTYTTQQVDAIYNAHTTEVALIQSNPVVQSTIQPNNPNQTGIIIEDPDEEISGN